VRLESPEIVKWNDTVGSAQTCTVEIVHDSQGSGTSSAFTDAEVWLEIQYLGTSGVPLGSVLTDAKADVLATAADQASSAVTWTTTGLTTPLKQKVAVTFTAQEIGFIHAKVVLAKASAVCYVDPKLTVA
jgi:ABC-type phosphate transport system substrate-binding protein